MRKIFTLVFIVFAITFMAKAQFPNATQPDSRDVNLVTSGVKNTGSDVFDNGIYRVEAIVNDGSNANLVINENGIVLSKSLGNIFDAKVAIGYDDVYNPTFCSIIVTYYDITNQTQSASVYKYIFGLGNLGSPVAGYSLKSATNPVSGPNIDLREDSKRGAITYESNGNIYVHAVEFGHGVNQVYGIGNDRKLYPGTQSDITAGPDYLYLCYVEPSHGEIYFLEMTYGDLVPNIPPSPLPNQRSMTTNAFQHPHIALFPNTAQCPTNLPPLPGCSTGIWICVFDDGKGIWHNTGTGQHTSFTVEQPIYQSGNYNTKPEIVINNLGAFQIAWETGDLVGATILGFTSGQGFQYLPFIMGAGCPPSNIGSTGVSVLGYQHSVSLGGRHTNNGDFIAAYSDDGSNGGCTDEVLFKNNYSASTGFRKMYENDNGIVNTILVQEKLTISPNPFTENIKITSTNNDAVCNLIITDISGKQIVNTIGNTATLNTAVTTANATLNAGIYFINIKNDSGILLNEKIVKQ